MDDAKIEDEAELDQDPSAKHQLKLLVFRGYISLKSVSVLFGTEKVFNNLRLDTKQWMIFFIVSLAVIFTSIYIDDDNIEMNLPGFVMPMFKAGPMDNNSRRNRTANAIELISFGFFFIAYVILHMHSIALRLCCSCGALRMHCDAQLHHKLSAVAYLTVIEAQRAQFVAVASQWLWDYVVMNFSWKII
jgi:hypothetical protein